MKINWRNIIEDACGCSIVETLHHQGHLAGSLKMPFGKYEGRELMKIPLSYLDQVVSTMPPQWIVRQVQLFVDAAMNDLRGREKEPMQVPNRSYHDCLEIIKKKLFQ
jgi:uncharacterized protein (DUF3820 family)